MVIQLKKEKKFKNGMFLENLINKANQYYLKNNLAVIYKKPTPVQIVKVEYPRRSRAKIYEAYYTVPSTTDYNGLYKGYYIDFEAKETSNKTSFALNNIHDHQVIHLKNILIHKGISFIIIYFKYHMRYFLLESKYLLKYWENKETGRKSIPFSEFLINGYTIYKNQDDILDYLKIVQEIIDKIE